MAHKVDLIQPTFRKMDGNPVKGFTLASCPLELPLLSAIIPDHWEKSCTHEYFDEINYDTDANVIFIVSPTNDIVHARNMALDFKMKGKTVIFGAHEDKFSESILQKVCDSYYRGIPDKSDMKRMLADFESGNLKPVYNFGTNFNYPFDYSVYRGKNVRFIHVQASGGCLFKCEYCRHPYSSNGGAVNLRDINCIIEDLKSVRKLTKYAAFKDPNFYNNRDHLLKLCRRIVDENIGLKWGAQMPIYVGNDDEALELMKKAGCKVIYVGFETLNQENLKSVNKPFKTSSYLKLVKNIRKKGINVVGYFMFGFDHDTSESFDQVYEFVRNSHLSYPLLNILTPIPGTPLYERMKKENRVDMTDPETFLAADPLYSIPCNMVYYEPKNMSRTELQRNFMELSRKLSTFPELIRRSFQRFSLDSFIILKMNYSFRKDYLRMKSQLVN